MAKTDSRPVDVGLTSLKGQDEAALVEWWKNRLVMTCAIPQDTARLGAMLPQLRELSRIDEKERERLTRARLIAFSQLPQDQQRVLLETRERGWEVDPGVLQEDQKTMDKVLPSLDQNIQTMFKRT